MVTQMRRALLLLFVVTLLACCAFAQSTGMIGYGINNSSVPTGQAAFTSWLWNNLELVVGGGDTGFSLATGRKAWTDYVDGCCLYLYDIYPYVLATAATQGWADPEGPLMHMNVDYQAA